MRARCGCRRRGPQIEEGSVDVAGEYRASADSAGSFLEVYALRQARQRELRRHIGRSGLRIGLQARVGNNVYDRAGTGAPHGGQECLDAMVGSVEVGSEQPVIVILRQGPEAAGGYWFPRH